MLQHQIVQSPARLGLPNPNSPSLPNPFPPKLQLSNSNPNPQSNFSPTSLSLLHLLPPLPRAQALLSLMANIVPKLFEVSPKKALWLSSFRGAFPTFISSQSPSSPAPPAMSSTSEVISLISRLQSQLFQAVAELQDILDLQDAKTRIARDVRAKDASIADFARNLKESERVLDNLLDDYSDYRHLKKPRIDDESTPSSRIKLSDILSYSHRISYTTFAPPEFGAGMAPLRGALPPAPQDEQMRASSLYTFADLDVGLPKEVEKTVEAIVEPPPMITQQEAVASSFSMISPSITVPSGWRPGMPVELPKDLPVPPPGWKPGDPLPPLDSIAMPKIFEQHLSNKGPEPIQVRHVQLDILDQDDDSSDYSSNDGSSDED